MSSSQIAIVTVFLPRMEMDHLAEWLEYHQRLGVGRFYLYNNGHISHDHIFRNGPPEKIWQKKPEANYHLDLTDEEVDERIETTIKEAGPGVFHIPWPSGSDDHRDYYYAQMMAANGQLNELKQAQDVQWLACLDIDELLVPVREPLSSYLDNLDEDVAAVKMSQRLFETRWQDKKSIPYSELVMTYGTLGFNHKLIARVSHARCWVNPHAMNVSSGRVWRAPASELRFHHFRGNQHHGPPAPKTWGVNRYVKLERPVERDHSHVM